MSTTPFLTALDARAVVKGSRDPLGLQPAWTKLGRDLVGNLTTVTVSYRNFTSHLLAQYLADEAVSRRIGSEAERCDFFLRAEQLIGYSRVASRADEDATAERILGITRIKSRLATAGARLRLSSRGEGPILSDQKTYGLWGLYTIASRRSGLTDSEVNRPSALGRELLERHILPALQPACGREARRLLDFVREGCAFEPRGAHAAVALAISEVHARRPSPAVLATYDETLVQGSVVPATEGRQSRLWSLLASVNDAGTARWADPFDLRELNAVRAAAARAGDDDLAERLHRIASLEPVLVAAALLFGRLLEGDGRPLASLVSDVRATWGPRMRHVDADAVARLRRELVDAVRPQGFEKLSALARAFREGDYDSALRTCVEQNAEVMQERGGRAWVELGDDRVRVLMRQDTEDLPPAAQLRERLDNPYFLHSLKTIGAQVHGKVA